MGSERFLPWEELGCHVGVKINDLKDRQLTRHLKELTKWNKKFNLTSQKDPTEIQIKHFQDSMAVSVILPEGDFALVDIGSGAGFPGLVLKILKPSMGTTLIEPNTHKYNFLCHMRRVLKLEGLDILKRRFEVLISEGAFEGKPLVFISRAWKKPKKVIETVGPILCSSVKNGKGSRKVLVIMLGKRAREEVKMLKEVARKFSLEINKQQEIELERGMGRRLNISLDVS